MKLSVGKPFFKGKIHAPPSKSHTIRAFICAALADNPSYIRCPLISGDTTAALDVLRQLGAVIREVQAAPLVLEVRPPPQGVLELHSTPAETVLNLGNSGSLLYFLGVLLTAAAVPVCLTGDRSLQNRPASPLTVLYRQAGISYSVRKDKDGNLFPPIRFCGPLKAGDFRLRGPFSQPVTGLLLTAPLLKGISRIFFEQAGERPYLRMTCGWLKTAGIAFSCRNEQYFEITGPQRYAAFSKTIPGDWSSALFPLTAAVICNAALTVTHLDPADSQGDSQVIDILRAMGADIRCDLCAQTVSVHPIDGSLKGGCFDCTDIPDAVPILAAAALFCTGETVLMNAGVCRFKECDRLRAAAEELTRFGADITEGRDFLRIEGRAGQDLHPAQVWSRKDHRIAMMSAVAACGVAARLNNTGIAGITSPLSIIEDFDCVCVSYPDFVKDMNAAGASFTVTDNPSS